jgi:hypothetical protein
MAESNSRASGGLALRPRTRSPEFGFRQPSQPTVRFDDQVPAGVDPEIGMRMATQNRGRRVGSTQAQREGKVPSYTPGYGRGDANNSPYGITPDSQWDSVFTEGHNQTNQHKFTPSPAPSISQQPSTAGSAMPFREVGSGGAQIAGVPVGGVTPPIAAATPSAPPVLPPAAIPPATQPTPTSMPLPGGYQTGNPIAILNRSQTPGTTAETTNVPGQNTKPQLAKRKVLPTDPVDPFS